jgi:transposase
VHTMLRRDPFSGHVFSFRGRRGDLIKLLWWDGEGLCLFAKRLERGRFVWARTERGITMLTPRSFRCCWRGSTGGDLCARHGPSWRCSCDSLTQG